MIGLEDNKVDEAIQIISDACAPVIEPGTRRATLFVLHVDQYTQI
jgi:uncharacterized protein YaaQ